MSTRTRAPQRFARSALRALGVPLFVAAQLCSLVHMAAVRHERCEEHGELVEVSGAPQVEHAAGTTAGLFAHSAVEREHEHCPIAHAQTTLRTAHMIVAQSDVAAPLAREAHAIPAPLVSRDVLVDAPKQGPPSAEA